MLEVGKNKPLCEKNILDCYLRGLLFANFKIILKKKYENIKENFALG
jgi:hypothetical protein